MSDKMVLKMEQFNFRVCSFSDAVMMLCLNLRCDIKYCNLYCHQHQSYQGQLSCDKELSVNDSQASHFCKQKIFDNANREKYLSCQHACPWLVFEKFTKTPQVLPRRTIRYDLDHRHESRRIFGWPAFCCFGVEKSRISSCTKNKITRKHQLTSQ